MVAAVWIAILLLIGVEPHLVFLPGHALKSAFAAFGIPVHNRVGVLATVFFWWLVLIAVAWLVRRRSLASRGPQER
jgi:hypothetical protein